jgi:AhpD family alkylhydroperoxidase
MALSEILHPTNDAARVEELLGRVQEKLGNVPQAYRTLAISQGYLNDSLYNLKKTMASGELDLATKHLIALAIASVAGGASMVEARTLEAQRDGLSDDAIVEALTVAASITQYNVFYKFQYLAGEGYDAFRPGYKLNVFLRPAVLSMMQVELVCAMVSVVNACPSCVRGHVAKAREHGATVAQIEEGLRVAALIAGIATFSKAEPAAAMAEPATVHNS